MTSPPTSARAVALVAVVALVVAGCTDGPETTGSAVEPSTPASSTVDAEATSDAPSSTEALRPGEPEVLVDGLDVPWGIGLLPDGDALLTERDSGRVLRVPVGSSQAQEVGTVPVDDSGEGGLLGLAVSPTFAQDRMIFLYRSVSDSNEVIRFAYDEAAPDGGLGAAEPVLTGIPSGRFHNGGRLAFGPDGLLYVSTGDATEGNLAQDVDSLGGKVLRIRADGSVPADNPFPGSPVWTYGHRNVQGLAWDDAGVLYATEFGQDTFDEVNRLEPGNNYGWPVVEGAGGGAEFTDPLLTWRPSEASPSGAAIVGDALYVAALRGERLWRVPLVGDGEVGAPEPLLTGELGRLRAAVQAPDGSLWVTTSNGDQYGGGDGSPDRLVRLPLVPAG